MDIYKGKYKSLLIIPVILYFLFAFTVFIYPGIVEGLDLKGGSLLVIRAEKPIPETDLQNFLEQEYDLIDLQVNAISSPLGNGVRIQFQNAKILADAEAELELARNSVESNPNSSITSSKNVLDIVKQYFPATVSGTETASEMLDLAENSFLKAKEAFNEKLQTSIIEEYSLGENIAFQKSEIAPVLGQIFWQSALWIALFSFVIVIVVIFLFFREVVPSIAIILAAGFDILAAGSAMAVFGIPLSLASIPTLLMLVGYSIDTDILLTTRVLKRRDDTPRERTRDSMKTGLTMTITTISTVIVLLVFSYFSQIQVTFDIAFVLLFGLIGDIVSTWFMNAPILLWYAERKQRGASVA